MLNLIISLFNTRAINEAKPSFIRIEADELTYPLHIMIRYEIEIVLIATGTFYWVPFFM